MYEELKSFIVDNDRYYFLLDELQEITGWEKVEGTIWKKEIPNEFFNGYNPFEQKVRHQKM